jgi:hypothetical protein
MKFSTFFTGGIVPGTVRAGKAVVADANKAVDTLDITTPKVGGTTVTATAAELNKNAGVTAGTVAASKVVVADANKDVGTFRNLRSAFVFPTLAAATYATAGAQTYTAADIVGGIIVRDPNGAGRSDVLPTAANLVAAVPGAVVGDTIRCIIVNGADAAETITIGAGSGGAFDTNQTSASRVIPQNASKIIHIRLTNVTASSEAYVAYL